MAFLDEHGLAEVWACADDVFGRVVHGSYDGTGTYGNTNPNSLTFDFVPKFLMITGGDGGSYWVNGGPVMANMAGTGYVNHANPASLDGTTLSWYSTGSARSQLNQAGITYNYIAIV